jgi:YidC/Oxa1 family membrane protein insertase
MNIWGQIVNTMSLGLFFLSQVFGGSTGLAIITLSCIIRLALLPITIAVQRRMQQQKDILKSIQPKIDKIKSRYKNNPEKLAQKTMQLYKEAGYKPFDILNILGNLSQLPLVGALYSAIRQGLSGSQNSFLWIKNLAQPDALLAVLVAGLTFLSTQLSADSSQQVQTIAKVIPAAITLFFAWKLSAGLGLYWATSTTIGMAQSLILRKSNSGN